MVNQQLQMMYQHPFQYDIFDFDFKISTQDPEAPPIHPVGIEV